MKRISIFLVTLYQLLLSPLLSLLSGGRVCRYELSCSEYTKQSIQKNGIIAGVRHGTKRFLSCRPGSTPYGITL